MARQLDFIDTVEILRAWRVAVAAKLEVLPLHPGVEQQAYGYLAAMDEALFEHADLLTAARLCKAAVDAIAREARLLANTGGEVHAAEIEAGLRQLRIEVRR